MIQSFESAIIIVAPKDAVTNNDLEVIINGEYIDIDDLTIDVLNEIHDILTQAAAEALKNKLNAQWSKLYDVKKTVTKLLLAKSKDLCVSIELTTL